MRLDDRCAPISQIVHDLDPIDGGLEILLGRPTRLSRAGRVTDASLLEQAKMVIEARRMRAERVRHLCSRPRRGDQILEHAVPQRIRERRICARLAGIAARSRGA